MEFIDGGVTAAKGFMASGLHCGIRKNRSKSDLALIVSDRPCAAAGVYTQNLVKGAPVALTQRNLADGIAQAVICNSGIANTCAPDGRSSGIGSLRHCGGFHWCNRSLSAYGEYPRCCS